MQNMKRTLVLLLFSLGFYVKLYEGTMNFQYIQNITQNLGKKSHNVLTKLLLETL